jgi:putative ABC transport system substrate-binding protein
MNFSKPALSLVGALLLSCWAPTQAWCGGKVAVLLSNGSEPFMEALRGFQQTASFEFQTINLESNASAVLGLNAQNTRCVVAFGPQAVSQGNALADLPLVYSLVLNPVPAGKRRVAGVVIRVGVEEQFSRMQKIFPECKRIGVIYNPQFSDETIREARRVGEKHGLTLVAIAVSKEDEIPNALAKYTKDSVDILWMVLDQTLVNPSVVKQFIVRSLETNLPLVGLSVYHVKAGALMAFSPDYVDVGSQTAECAQKLVDGGTISHESPRVVIVYVNAKIQKQMGLKDLSAFSEVKMIQ